ncbi:hypothetical protein VL21_16880 [Stenotrophomonas maltophilia]|nr:hypothetical protein B7H26_06845 [Stenotrophomonas maltophilia]KOO75993.1 hypothetical protein VL21_16880 [Stenotrophomonas maltophilia]
MLVVDGPKVFDVLLVFVGDDVDQLSTGNSRGHIKATDNLFITVFGFLANSFRGIHLMPPASRDHTSGQ